MRNHRGFIFILTVIYVLHILCFGMSCICNTYIVILYLYSM